MSYTPPVTHHLHPSFAQPLLKSWNTEHTVSADNIMYPIFVVDQPGVKEEIKSLPGQYRWSVERLPELLDELIELGLRSVIIFGVVTDTSKKTPDGAYCYHEESPAVRATAFLRERYPNLIISCDVCLCAYTSHGHCGTLFEDGSINNAESIQILAKMSVTLAKAGCQVIAPSDMMDGRIGAIKHELFKNNLGSKVSVMSYSAKFASCFYGPFRDAAGSGCKFGDRGCYQLPAGSRGLALRAMQRDIEEGADFLMVKPGMPYLDIVRDCSELASKKGIPVAIYQVSGEYAMLYHAAKAGAFGLEEALMESLLSMRRAGVTIILTYFAKEALTALKRK